MTDPAYTLAHPLARADDPPGTPPEGARYYNTTRGVDRVYIDGDWVDLPAGCLLSGAFTPEPDSAPSAFPRDVSYYFVNDEGWPLPGHLVMYRNDEESTQVLTGYGLTYVRHSGSAALWDGEWTALLTSTEGAATFASAAGVARFVGRALAGEGVKITFVGDSILEGSTAGTPGTTDAASLLVSTLAARYGVTVTKSNRAVSGRTAQRALLSDFTAALTDAADLYVIAFGHNDEKSGATSPAVQPGWGYPRAASIAATEHMIRRIRKTLPFADILLLSENPYSSDYPTSTALIAAYARQQEKLARYYGCAWADGLAAFTALSDWDDQLAVDGAHPNDGGHELLANAMLGLFPATMPVAAAGPAVVPEGLLNTNAAYYDTRGWAATLNSARTTGLSGYSMNGSWTGSGPYVSAATGAGVNMQSLFVGSEAVLLLTGGAGAGTVNIDVDGNRLFSNVDLSTYPSGVNRIPITGLAPGVHTMYVRVVSGTVTVNGLEFLAAPVETFDLQSTRVTLGGTWGTSSTNDGNYFNRKSNTTSTSGDTFAFECIGTDISVHMLRLASGGAAVTLTPTVDGVALTAISAVGSASNQGPGQLVLATGLPYGRHTVSVAITIPSGSITLGTISVFDGTRLARPRRQRGVAKVGEAPIFAAPFTGRPAVTVYAADGTSAVPPSVSTLSPTSITLAGTASALVGWDAEGSLLAF